MNVDDVCITREKQAYGLLFMMINNNNNNKKNLHSSAMIYIYTCHVCMLS